MAGESVLTSSRDVSDGSIAVRLGAQQETFAWDSELPTGYRNSLIAPADRSVGGTLASGHVTGLECHMAGLSPVFESDQPELIPVWRPWPGEAVTIELQQTRCGQRRHHDGPKCEPRNDAGQSSSHQQTRARPGVQPGGRLRDPARSRGRDFVAERGSEYRSRCNATVRN